jgi:hypothetical protein
MGKKNRKSVLREQINYMAGKENWTISQEQRPHIAGKENLYCGKRKYILRNQKSLTTGTEEQLCGRTRNKETISHRPI